MMANFIALFASYLSLETARFWFFPFLALFFVVTVPALIRKFITWR